MVKRALAGWVVLSACYAGVDPEAPGAGTEDASDSNAAPTSTADDDDTPAGLSTSTGGSTTSASSTTASSSDSSPTSTSGDDASASATGSASLTTDDDPSSDGSGDPTSGGGTMPGEPTADEAELLELINEYRMANGLPAIPTSTSMMIVAQTHAEDLAVNDPAVGACNLHSWSDAGPWTPCCYTPDHAQAQCMWDKPRELTDYPGNGYEISAAGTPTAASALSAWQGSPAHNDVILNQGIWADNPWGAIGAGMHSGYAVVWFGVESD